MCALLLVALGRPGWLAPNSADIVRAKALQQEEELRESPSSRKRVWVGSISEALRGCFRDETQYPTCTHCSAVLSSARRRSAHATPTPDSQGRTGCQRFLWRLAERRRDCGWRSRLLLAIRVLIPEATQFNSERLAWVLHRAINAYDLDAAHEALRADEATAQAEADADGEASPSSAQGTWRDVEPQFEEGEPTIGLPLEERTHDVSDTPSEQGRDEHASSEGTGAEPQEESGPQAGSRYRGLKRRRESF